MKKKSSWKKAEKYNKCDKFEKLWYFYEKGDKITSNLIIEFCKACYKPFSKNTDYKFKLLIGETNEVVEMITSDDHNETYMLYYYEDESTEEDSEDEDEFAFEKMRFK